MSGTLTLPGRIPFESGPPRGFASWLGLIRAGDPRVMRRAVLAVAVGWLPLAFLTLLRGDFIRPDHANAFILDFGAQARFLITAPLLILAESLCGPRLAAIARQFVVAGLVAEADRPAYERAVVSTQRLLDSTAAEIAAFVLAYALVVALLIGRPEAMLPAWHGALSGHIAPTPAGWWGLLVSLPMLLVLLLGWLWRIWLWTRFLWLMSRMRLHLIPSHPDHAGGLKFVGYSLESFTPLGFALGVLGAGVVANLVVHHGAPPSQFRYHALGVAAFVVVLFTTPLLVFVRRLIEEHHRGILAYGAFSVQAGQEFEHKWIEPRPAIDEQTLRLPEFAATNGLYGICTHAFAMARVPFELRSVLILAGSSLVPFAPLVLLAVPLDVLLRKAGGFFL